jgi:glucosylceramidase
MKNKLKIYFLGALILFAGLNAASGCKKKETTPDSITPKDSTNSGWAKTDVVFWLTNADESVLLTRQNVGLLFNTEANQFPTIEVDTSLMYQTIDGFGCTLTGASAYLMNKMTTFGRDALIKELFSRDSACIGINYIRISIGASDLSTTVFSYDDMAAGQTDTDLINFSLENERVDLIPVLKLVLLQNPGIKILGSPWSAPVWMKTNNSSIGGSLLPAYYDAYARYLVKYIQGMQVQGIPIDAITIQNEPLNPYNNPSMVMTAAEQAAFIKNNLGPAFIAAGITTKIILYDHNCDRPDYPISVLNDADARQYVDGSAFHLYGGDITALSQVHAAYPEKNVYFTEQWVGGPSNFGPDMRWHVKNLIIGATRNWSKNVLEWNLASDASYNPHTDGGCSSCEGAVTISSSSVTRNVSYYIMAHASKYVPSGSVRIGSNITSNLQNVAFRTPDGRKVLIVLNDGESTQTFNIKYKGRKVTSTLKSSSVATYVW